MSSNASGAGEGEIEPLETVSIYWLILLGFFLTVTLTVFAGLMKTTLGVDTSQANIVGIVLIVSAVSTVAPATKRQLGQLVLVLGVASTLAVLLAMAPEIFAWGFWGSMLAIGLAAMLGSLIIALSLKRLNIGHRMNVKDDAA